MTDQERIERQIDKEVVSIVEETQGLMDHVQYFSEVLQKFTDIIEESDDPVLEVGTNMGGSAMCFAKVLSWKKKNNWLFCVDPYGGIRYHNGAHWVDNFYTNERYRKAMRELYDCAYWRNVNVSHFKQTSEDFCNETFPNLKIYDNSGVKKVERFSFVHLDGSHDPEVVKKEILFFAHKIHPKGAIVVDDYEGERFGNFWDEFFKGQNQFLTMHKTQIHQKVILEYK